MIRPPPRVGHVVYDRDADDDDGRESREERVAEVVPFPRGEGDGLTRAGVLVLAQLWRLRVRLEGPQAGREAVKEHARTVAHALIEAFGPRAAEYAAVLARALIEEIR